VGAGDRERWDARYQSGEHRGDAAPDWLAELDSEWPAPGRLLEVAAGTARVARWFAARGWRALALDVSPVALGLAREAARAQGVQLETRACDLESEPLPQGPFELVACFHYLQRELFPALRASLAPGGCLVCEIATVRNLERHSRPAARFLLAPNELLQLCAPLEIVYYREGWLGDRALARAVARRPVAPAQPA
jgi:SAM-dependent methyltransferase